MILLGEQRTYSQFANPNHFPSSSFLVLFLLQQMTQCFNISPISPIFPATLNLAPPSSSVKLPTLGVSAPVPNHSIVTGDKSDLLRGIVVSDPVAFRLFYLHRSKAKPKTLAYKGDKSKCTYSARIPIHMERSLLAISKFSC